MTDIRKHAVSPTSTLHLRDAEDMPMYADDASGQPDLNRPMMAVLYGPGSKEYKKAQVANSNRMIERLKKKGKTDISPEEQARETAEFLAACTQSLDNVEYAGLAGEALFLAVYGDAEIGFVAEQVNKHIGDWANFTKPSQAK